MKKLLIIISLIFAFSISNAQSYKKSTYIIPSTAAVPSSTIPAGSIVLIENGGGLWMLTEKWESGAFSSVTDKEPIQQSLFSDLAFEKELTTTQGGVIVLEHIWSADGGNGFAGGAGATASIAGGAVGGGASTTSGGSAGQGANSTSGFAGGLNSETINGGAVGEEASAIFWWCCWL